MRSKCNETARLIEDFVNSYYEAKLRTPTLREIESSTGVSRQTAQRYLKSMSEDGRLKYEGRGGIISLRHSCVSMLVAQGVPMKQVQLRLGHSTFSTTADIYAHLSTATLAEPARVCRCRCTQGGGDCRAIR